jgi:hypothetical protein
MNGETTMSERYWKGGPAPVSPMFTPVDNAGSTADVTDGTCYACGRKDVPRFVSDDWAGKLCGACAEMESGCHDHGIYGCMTCVAREEAWS